MYIYPFLYRLMSSSSRPFVFRCVVKHYPAETIPVSESATPRTVESALDQVKGHVRVEKPVSTCDQTIKRSDSRLIILPHDCHMSFSQCFMCTLYDNINVSVLSFGQKYHIYKNKKVNQICTHVYIYRANYSHIREELKTIHVMSHLGC